MLTANFEDEKKKFSLKTELLQFRQEIGKLAKIDDVKKENQSMKDMM